MARSSVASIVVLSRISCLDRMYRAGTAMSPPHRSTGFTPALRFGYPSVEGSVECGQHMPLECIEQRRIAVPRTRQVDRDLLEQASGMRTHHQHAIGQHDRLLDVVG